MPARRILQHAFALLALGSFGALCGAGCVDAEATFLVRHVATIDSGNCVCSPDGDTFLSGGSFEANVGGDYAACLVVINGLDELEDRSRPRAETNYIEIYAVDVTLEGDGFVATPDCPASFTFPSKGFVEPESLGVVSALAIPSCVTMQLQENVPARTSTTMIATFVVHGHTSGGDEVETPEYTFPISVGRGLYCAADEDDVGTCRIGADGNPAPPAFCQ